MKALRESHRRADSRSMD